MTFLDLSSAHAYDHVVRVNVLSECWMVGLASFIDRPKLDNLTPLCMMSAVCLEEDYRGRGAKEGDNKFLFLV